MTRGPGHDDGKHHGSASDGRFGVPTRREARARKVNLEPTYRQIGAVIGARRLLYPAQGDGPPKAVAVGRRHHLANRHPIAQPRSDPHLPNFR